MVHVHMYISNGMLTALIPAGCLSKRMYIFFSCCTTFEQNTMTILNTGTVHVCIILQYIISSIIIFNIILFMFVPFV